MATYKVTYTLSGKKWERYVSNVVSSAEAVEVCYMDNTDIPKEVFVQIAYVAPVDSGEYVDLGWSGQRYGKGKVENTGVFVLISKYTDFHSENGMVGVSGEEINGVFSTRKKAEKMGNWLLKTSKESPDDFGEDETLRIYNSYEVRNFLIL